MRFRSDTDWYANIDVKRTGLRLKTRLEGAGVSASDLKKELGLGARQSVYRWYRGEILPSLDHFFRIAQILECGIDDLIVVEGEKEETDYLLLGGSPLVLEKL